MTVDENTLPTPDKNEYVNDCLKRHVAPIKQAFLLPRQPATGEENSAAGSLNQTSDDIAGPSITAEEEEELDSQLENNRKRKAPRRPRGQNKQRKANIAVAILCKKQQLCRLVATGKKCDREDVCSFSHDADAVIKIRKERQAEAESNGCPESLKICPWHRQSLECPYGLNCHCLDEHELQSDDKTISSQNANCGEFNGMRDILDAVKKARREKKDDNTDNSLLLTDDVAPAHQSSASDEVDINKFPTQGVSEMTSEPVAILSDPCPFQRLRCVESSVPDRASPDEKRARLSDLLKGKVILAPLTTVGNLPFRRLCIQFGAQVTMSEMVLAQSICSLKSSELALLRRHEDEKIFGIQLAGGFPDKMSQAVDILNRAGIAADWIDINMGCPLSQLHDKGAGCILMRRETHLKNIIEQMSNRLNVPLTIKCRMAFANREEPTFHELAPKLIEWGCSGIALHGRSAQQRYSHEAKWDYISLCRAQVADKGVFIGNGDLFEPHQIAKLWQESQSTAVMIGRGALMKPWIFEEIRRGELWDISSHERFEMLKKFCDYGLYHWGSDSKGVESTRRFLLEHLSFFHRYIPVGLLERVPQNMNHKPPPYCGRDDMETLMSKSDVKSWINISELLLGKVPEEFSFIPKHKSSSYE